MSEYIERPKTFKKLVEMITAMASEEDRNRVYWNIDRSFERETIKWQEHELLFDLASRVMI